MKKSELDEVYPFARFNRKIEVVKYTDEEYKNVVAPLNSDWSKEETDHLFKLCEKYSLRFIIIADRFDEESDNEENKAKDNDRKRDQKHKDKD